MIGPNILDYVLYVIVYTANVQTFIAEDCIYKNLKSV